MTREKPENIIAITVKENNLDSELDDCFGKSHFFFLADIANKKFEFIKNPGLESTKFSGKKAALFLVHKGVKTIVSSNFGAHVKQILDKNKIQIVLLSGQFRFLKDIYWLKDII